MSRTNAVTRAEFDALIDRIEDLEDAVDLRAAASAAGTRDYLSVDLVKRMIAGESRIRLWREHRGMTAKALAEAAGVNAAYLSQIERGAKPGSVKAVAAIAAALGVTVDDLI